MLEPATPQSDSQLLEKAHTYYDSGAKGRWLTLDFFSPFQTQAYNNATLLIFLTRPIRLE